MSASVASSSFNEDEDPIQTSTSENMERKKPAFTFRPLQYDRLVRTNDDIHSSITLDPITHAFLSTPHLQRLRGLKQLGTVEHVYVNATHTRFEHSLGVMHLAEKVCKILQRRQPNLRISDKDVLCVKLAGLMHDLGHGPFSHIYDGVFVPAIKAQTAPSGKSDDAKAEKWTHEDGSVMMIDAALRHLGLEADMNDLDAPLKQVGDGIDAMQFGYRAPEDDFLKPENIITSRDMVFIKECILGGPLRGYREFLGRPRSAEFLYDIVSNRHCGLDVDKIDYYARDQRRTHGASHLELMFIEEAVVAKARCSQPMKCFQCKHFHGRPGIHYMIAWPDKLIVKAMEFFKTRFSMHSKVYTHKTVKAVEYMVTDALIEADPYVKIPSSEGRFEQISSAMNDPAAYVKLKDSVLDTIEMSTEDDLEPARKVLKRLRSRELYKCAVEQRIKDEIAEHAWTKSQEFIKAEILGVDCRRYDSDGNAIEIREDDVIVEKRVIHHGLKESNPVSRMRFLQKRNLAQINAETVERLPEAREIEESSYDAHIPRTLLEKTIRVFSRDSNPVKVDLIRHAFYQWYHDSSKVEATTAFSPAPSAHMLTQDSDWENSPVPSVRKHIQSSHSEFKKRKAWSMQAEYSPPRKEVARDFKSIMS